MPVWGSILSVFRGSQCPSIPKQKRRAANPSVVAPKSECPAQCHPCEAALNGALIAAVTAGNVVHLVAAFSQSPPYIGSQRLIVLLTIADSWPRARSPFELGAFHRYGIGYVIASVLVLVAVLEAKKNVWPSRFQAILEQLADVGGDGILCRGVINAQLASPSRASPG
jgi:hypothetical protein